MLIITVAFWDRMPVTQRLIGIYYFLIAAHEWEEMKYPGGFVEMVISLTGMPVKNMTVPKFCLFLITVYMLLVPLIIVQRFIVTRLMKMSYKEFVTNAKNSILGKRDIR